MGGYNLGGGNSIFSRTIGLMIDYIREITIITADGQIRTVNSNQNQDLFYALKGSGGGNWGIVTEYIIELLPKPEFLTSVFTIQ